MSCQEYLTAKQLAARWKISIYTLSNWRKYGKGPVYFKMGGEQSHARYALHDIEKYEQENMSS